MRVAESGSSERKATPGPGTGTGRIGAVLLVVITSLALGRVCGHEFGGFDDYWTLFENPRMTPPGVEKVLHYWKHPEGNLYVPVTWTVWGALAGVAYLDAPDAGGIRLNPWVFHTANLVVHLLAALTALALLRRLVPNELAAWVGAMLFAVHPVQVETVAWTSGMKDLLFGLFSLLTLWQYVLSVQRPERRWVHYALATLCFVLGLLSKPTTMVVPAMALVLGRVVLSESWTKLARTVGPWLVVSAAWMVVTKLVQPATGVETAPVWARPLIAGDALAFYLYKLVLPTDLAPHYHRRPASVMGQGWFWATWLVPAAIAIILLVFRKRVPGVVAGALVFAIGVSPLLGLVPFEFQGYSTVSDHYLYLSVAGAGLAAAWVLARYGSKRVMTAAVMVVCVLAVRSAVQAGHWKNDRTIWEHTAKVNPNSWVATSGVATYLMDDGKIAEAERWYRRAVESYPQFAAGHEQLAVALVRQGKHAEAVPHLRTFIELARRDRPGAVRKPDLGPAYRQLARSLEAVGKPDEAAEASRMAQEHSVKEDGK